MGIKLDLFYLIKQQPKVLKQLNGNDCGVHVALNALHLIENKVQTC